MQRARQHFQAFGDARAEFDVRFYLVAILFIIFDLEIAFLFPWAVTLGQIGWFGFWSMMAFLVVLELMTPAERVAFVLHDVFRYSFAEVSSIVGRSEAACRQLASSARRRVRAAQPSPTPAAAYAETVRAFKRAWEAKDIEALIGLLATDATATGDGGGVVQAVLRPVEGAEEIASLIPDARLATVGSAGHHAAGDNPETTVDLVRSFLAETGA